MDKRYLFRVWIPEEQTMYKGSHIYINGGGEIRWVVVYNGETVETYFAGDTEFSIMSCTGLTAAKSYRGDSEDARLVYEGDIVEGMDGTIYLIVWNSFRAQFQGKVLECPNGVYDAGSRFMISQDSADGLEAIGTIHDRPELLGGAKGESV